MKLDEGNKENMFPFFMPEPPGRLKLVTEWEIEELKSSSTFLWPHFGHSVLQNFFLT